MGTRFQGKVAIVTGAARGLGRAYAKLLAGLGAKPVVDAVIEHASQPVALGMLPLA